MEESTISTKPEDQPETQPLHPARLIILAVMSVGFLGWVGLGQIEARVWVSGQLTFLDRRISAMWQYLGNNLPELPASGAISIVYWLSISFILIGTIAGLWLFLGTSDNDPNDQSITEIQAAHIQHENE